jgi:peptidyl-prolyl cis-trans isomerase SurA
MMKFRWFPRAATLVAVSLLPVVAAAQSDAPATQQEPPAPAAARAQATPPAAQEEAPTGTDLDIPEEVRFVGNQEPNVRKATAIVNGQVITESDINQRLALFLASNRVQLPPEQLQAARAQVLRNLIDETLEIQAAQQDEITIERREVDDYYKRFAESLGKTPESLSAYLTSVGSSEQSMRRQILGEMAWERLQRRRIEPFVTVGDDEVQAILNRLNASRGTSEYRVAEIYLSATPETMNEVRANAERILQQLRAGASFQAYARQFSEASTAAVGGELGWVRAEQLPNELAAAIQQMPIGAVSNPIEVPGGISIVALVDKRQILVADPRDAMLSLMQLSITMPANTPDAQLQARAQQLAEATQTMGGCGHARQTAQTLGAEVVSNDQVRVRDLPGALQPMLLALDVGQATQVFGSNGRISTLVLCGRDDPQQATAPSFDSVYNNLSQERVSRRAQRYLRDLRRDAVIDYR